MIQWLMGVTHGEPYLHAVHWDCFFESWAHGSVISGGSGVLLAKFSDWGCGLESRSSQNIVWILEMHFMVSLPMQLSMCLYDIISISNDMVACGYMRVSEMEVPVH